MSEYSWPCSWLRDPGAVWRGQGLLSEPLVAHPCSCSKSCRPTTSNNLHSQNTHFGLWTGQILPKASLKWYYSPRHTPSNLHLRELSTPKIVHRLFARTHVSACGLGIAGTRRHSWKDKRRIHILRGHQPDRQRYPGIHPDKINVGHPFATSRSRQQPIPKQVGDSIRYLSPDTSGGFPRDHRGCSRDLGTYWWWRLKELHFRRPWTHIQYSRQNDYRTPSEPPERQAWRQCLTFPRKCRRAVHGCAQCS